MALTQHRSNWRHSRSRCQRSAWDLVRGRGVVIAIVESGFQHDHPDLIGNRWTNPDEIAGNGIDDDNNGYVDDVYGWDESRQQQRSLTRLFV
ncbi:MAG: hypothetical protein GDA44_02495 [Prochloron sp. SP5CPC1]|nr:hypothetical protein [Candidatus Paraprochloron terpiosi SP5CPC1]